MHRSSIVVAVVICAACSGEPGNSRVDDDLTDRIARASGLTVLSIDRTPGRVDLTVRSDTPAATPELEFAAYAKKSELIWRELGTAVPDTLAIIAERHTADGAKERRVFFFYPRLPASNP